MNELLRTPALFIDSSGLVVKVGKLKSTLAAKAGGVT